MKAKCLGPHEVLEDPNAHEQAVEVAGTGNHYMHSANASEFQSSRTSMPLGKAARPLSF